MGNVGRLLVAGAISLCAASVAEAQLPNASAGESFVTGEPAAPAGKRPRFRAPAPSDATSTASPPHGASISVGSLHQWRTMAGRSTSPTRFVSPRPTGTWRARWHWKRWVKTESVSRQHSSANRSDAVGKRFSRGLAVRSRRPWQRRRSHRREASVRWC